MTTARQKPNIRIGVLGGIGPEATGTFYLKLISALQASGKIKSNTDFPQIIINSIPAPELIGSAVTDEQFKPYLDGAKELDAAGVDLIVMVCNTIHLYHAQLQSAVTAEMLDLRKEVKHVLHDKDKVVVLGTPSTIRRGLYTYPGIGYLNPDKEEQKTLSDCIFQFNRGQDKDAQVEKVRSIVRKKIEAGAQAAILACTEFAVMLAGQDIPTIDTIDVMVDAVVRRYLKMREVG